jgi:hypothetical protein
VQEHGNVPGAAASAALAGSGSVHAAYRSMVPLREEALEWTRSIQLSGITSQGLGSVDIPAGQNLTPIASSGLQQVQTLGSMQLTRRGSVASLATVAAAPAAPTAAEAEAVAAGAAGRAGRAPRGGKGGARSPEEEEKGGEAGSGREEGRQPSCGCVVS